MEVIDGGQIGDEEISFSQARNEIVELLDLSSSALSPIPMEQFEDIHMQSSSESVELKYIITT